jgi:glutathione S-transferase
MELAVLTVHHLNNSRSQRVLWLLEELGLPYEIKFYERDPVTRLAPPALRAIHPLGKSPVLVDGDVTVAETGAIVEHLVEKSGGRLRPEAGTPERRRWTYWLHFAEGSLMPPLVLDLVLASAPGRAPEPLREAAKAVGDAARQGYVAPNLKTLFDFVEAELARSPWFAGEEFSAADVMMSFPIEAAGARGDAFKGRPKLAAFIERIHARPAYRKALVRGGPYAYAE